MTIAESFKRVFRWRHRLTPLPYAYGGQYRRYSRLLERSLLYTDEELFDYTWKRIQSLLHIAYHSTGYYRDVFDRMGCAPDDIKTPGDYRRLPIINRSTIRENLERMKNRDFDRTQPILTITSGTTAYPLKMYRSKSVESLRKAVVWRHYNECGYRYKERRATLGRPLDFPKKQVYSRVDLLENNLWLNSFHLNPRDFIHLYNRLAEWQPKMLVGHPSALMTFCLQAQRAALSPISIPIIYSYAEKLYPHHIDRFSEFFGAKIYDYYGNRENTVAVTQMKCGSYHINPEFGYVEFIVDGNEAATEQTASIITTSLENYSVPLLRYDTGDLGTFLGRCENCKLAHPTLEILGGRGKDVLVTRDGYINCHLDTYLTRQGFSGADYIQVVQTEIDKIIVRILPNSKFDTDTDELHLKRLASDCLSGYFQVDIEYLDSPPFTEAGKIPYVVSKLLDTDDRA